MEKIMRNFHLQLAAVICTCFLLTSTAYLAWTYHIVELAEAPLSDAATLIAGYLFQAAGIGLFSLLLHRRAELVQKALYAALGLHVLFLLLSVSVNSFAAALAFGCILNLLCGWIGGYYLYRLTDEADISCSAMTLGIGYSAAIIASWLLSFIGKDLLHDPVSRLIVCVALTGAALYAVRMKPFAEASRPEETLSAEGGSHDPAPLDVRPVAPECPAKYELPQSVTHRQFLILAGALILLLSMVNSCGFSFPSDDIRNGISVEFSRLFYAAGLLVAGYANTKNRSYGAVCAVIALIIPFFMLAVRGEPVSRSILWALSYFTFGFYSIYRMILFSDIAQNEPLLPLCTFGLMIGRVGDAAGEALCLALAGHFLILVGTAVLLFMAAMLLFFRVYWVLYLPEPKKQRSEQEIFNHFSDTYNLSAREREVLRFLLEEKTNHEIAEELCISDGTVKYHIHNLLQKTGYPNRLKLLSAYAASRDAS